MVQTENKIKSLTKEEIRAEYQQIVKASQRNVTAKMVTSHGTMQFELSAHIAPATVENFIELANYIEFD